MTDYFLSIAGVVWLVTSALLLFWLLLTWTCLSRGRLRDLSAKIGMIGFSFRYTLLAADLFVGTTVIESNGAGVTLAHKRWLRQHWIPTINSYGYRDIEPQSKNRTLVMLGASFVAGGGIDRLEDTMAGVLRRKLGSEWSVDV